MVDVYRQAWTSREGAEIRFFNGDSEKTLTKKARQALTVLHESFAPSTQVLGNEEFFEAPLAAEVPQLQGYINLIEESPDGRVTIADLKTDAKQLATLPSIPICSSPHIPSGQERSDLTPTGSRGGRTCCTKRRILS